MEPHAPRNVVYDILHSKVFAVVGASRDSEKYGYKVYKKLKSAGYTVYPINPNADEIEGDPVYPRLDNVPEKVDCVVTVVPPSVTYDVVRQAGAMGIPFIWMQPGSESTPAILEAEAQGVQAVHSGPCIMVAVATHPRTEPPA